MKPKRDKLIAFLLARGACAKGVRKYRGLTPKQAWDKAAKNGELGNLPMEFHSVEDARHLWPAWGALIEQCRPSVVFGEQAASKDGRAWLDLVWADMEGWGYAFAPVLLPACGLGAPHRRNRLWFVADANGERYLPESEAAAQDEEWDLATHQQAGNSVGDEAGPSLYAPWPPGLSGIDRIPVATDGDSIGMGGIRASGNAIAAPVAAEFIRAYRMTRYCSPPQREQS
jgi:DNA (cytosine-5)-methyltransferase 1